MWKNFQFSQIHKYSYKKNAGYKTNHPGLI